MCGYGNDCGCNNIRGYVQAVEQAEGDEALKLMLAETEDVDPELPQCVCPKCLSDSIEFKQLNENYTGRAFYLQKCKDCGNQRIEYENKKINAYERMLKDGLWQ